MVKKSLLLVACSCLVILGACQSESAQKKSGLPEVVEADIQLPEEMEAGQEYPLKVVVTQGEENVDDAEEVVFEMTNLATPDESEKVDAVHDGKGMYSITTSFPKNGTYTEERYLYRPNPRNSQGYACHAQGGSGDRGRVKGFGDRVRGNAPPF